MNTKLKIGLGLLGVIILCLFIGPLRFIEGFKSLRYKSEDIRTPGEYPLTVDKPPLYDTYELKGSNIITSNGSAHNWKEYPVFALGSFKQITNNLRFRKSPDDGTASTGDFSDAIYNTKTVKTNIIEPDSYTICNLLYTKLIQTFHPLIINDIIHYRQLENN